MMRLLFLFLLIRALFSLEVKELKNITSHPNWKLLNPDRCGMTNSDRIVGGINAPMGAYPWLAQIGYVSRNATLSAPPIYACGGAVINRFYVITAAHCVADLEEYNEEAIVKLGEHDTNTNPDCEGSFCNEPYREYTIDGIFVHEKWDSPPLKHDIALLRVSKEIEFTDFVRPICMVRGRLLQKDFVGGIGEVAGWGFIDGKTKIVSHSLQTLKLPILPISTCKQKKPFEKYSIDNQQICAGGIKGQDSCSGDSGGPLMKVDIDAALSPPRYFIIGLVSFGLANCGSSDTPGVYTKTSEYLLWILDHLRP